MGVPQGSILGRVLFLLLINDITNFINSLLINADDTSVIVSGNTPTTLQVKVDSLLDLLDQLFVSNGLHINFVKINFTVFRTV